MLRRARYVKCTDCAANAMNVAMQLDVPRLDRFLLSRDSLVIPRCAMRGARESKAFLETVNVLSVASKKAAHPVECV
jgi:hypothetical protein